MVRRKRKRETKRKASRYFFDPSAGGIKRASSGCTLLDQALGGGWAIGRMVNLVGDSSAGKSLLAIELSTWALRVYAKDHDVRVIYRDCESAFDLGYANALGCPVDEIEGLKETDPQLETTQDMIKDVEKILEQELKPPKGKKKAVKKDLVLYIIDSMDALTDITELGKGVDDAAVPATKARLLHSLFRKNKKKITEANMLLFIISQVKHKIGVVFGSSKTRTGGAALDFYASQIVWISDVGKIPLTRKKIKRAVGSKIRAKVKKNKVGVAYREVDFPVMYTYGVDDYGSIWDWFKIIDDKNTGASMEAAGVPEEEAYDRADCIKYLEDNPKVFVKVKEKAKELWEELEDSFLTERKSKY